MNRRDLLLSEMGITQWQLKKSEVLKGDAQIRLNSAIKLVVICKADYQTTGLFRDVLYSLSLQDVEYQWLDNEQSQRLTVDHSILLWLIEEEQAGKIEQHFANQTIIQTASWNELAKVEEKRKLWKALEPFCNVVE